jgi:hypothetical protein
MRTRSTAVKARQQKFFIGYLKDEGREHPTGGLVDEPSSEAVEEAGHFERNCTPRKGGWQRLKSLKHGGKEGTED